MGTGERFKGGTPRQHSITENAAKLKEIFAFADGYFGKRGKSGHAWVRNIASSDPEATSKEFFDIASLGASIRQSGKRNQTLYVLSDGTVITYRKTSKSDGSPVVQIDIDSSNSHGDIKYQKIHFVKGE